MTKFVLFWGLVLASWGPVASAQGRCWKFLSRQALIEKVQLLAQAVTDLIFASVPRPIPPLEKLKRTKVVAHRGAHNNKMGILENTMEAFDLCLQNRLWGIEFDIRWTKDNVPVIHHDPNTGRLFATDLVIKDHTAAEIRQALPKIPRFEEVLAAYSGKMHLMIEIKETLTPEQGQMLMQMLFHLQPGRDYHLLALDAALFNGVRFIPTSAFLPVAETNTSLQSKAALDQNFGGVTGHYALLGRPYLEIHRGQSQLVGTGFINSSNALAREVNRDVEWIFTNHALQVRKFLDELIELSERLQGQ